MDGLECSEVLLSTARNCNNTFRIDSHYFEKQYLQLNKELLDLPHWYLKDIVSKPIQTGHTPSMKNDKYYGGEIALIKTDNLHANNIGQKFTSYLSSAGNAQIARTALQENDIITTIIGATEEVIARSSLVLPENLPSNINQNIVQIRVNEKVASPEYVNAYLNSRFGRQYLRYLSRQTEQVNLNCQEVGSTIVPKLSHSFQQEIKTCTVKAYELQKDANQFYIDAESILLSTLNMSNFLPDQQSVSIKLLSDSFGSSSRLDAEYYQPKYDSLFDCLSGLPCQELGALVDIEKSIEPGSKFYSDDGVPFVRVSDVTKFGITSSVINVPENLTGLRPKKDTILLSKDGSVGIAYKVEQDMDVITSSALLHLTVKQKNISPDYLALVLNSAIVRMQAERDAGGSIIQHWKPLEISKVVIPLLDDATQVTIAAQIKQSFELRRQSEQMLENAKSAVEIAIEQDEGKAMEWLKGKGVGR